MQKKSSSSQNKKEKVSRFHESCPLKLKSFPEGICEHGLVRARWMSDHSGYLAFEEKQARGCPFGLLTEDKHSYCFFKLMADVEEPFSEEEICRMLCLTKDQVRKIIDTVAAKLKNKEEIKTLAQDHKENSLSELDFMEEDIYFPDNFSLDMGGGESSLEEKPETVN